MSPLALISPVTLNSFDGLLLFIPTLFFILLCTFIKIQALGIGGLELPETGKYSFQQLLAAGKAPDLFIIFKYLSHALCCDASSNLIR